jgi:hypothetical protein
MSLSLLSQSPFPLFCLPQLIELKALRNLNYWGTRHPPNNPAPRANDRMFNAHAWPWHNPLPPPSANAPPSPPAPGPNATPSTPDDGPWHNPLPLINPATSAKAPPPTANAPSFAPDDRPVRIIYKPYPTHTGATADNPDPGAAPPPAPDADDTPTITKYYYPIIPPHPAYVQKPRRKKVIDRIPQRKILPKPGK